MRQCVLGRPGDPPCRGVSGLHCEGRTASNSEDGRKQQAHFSSRTVLFVKGVNEEDRSQALEASGGDPECTANCGFPSPRKEAGFLLFIVFVARCLVHTSSMLMQRQATLLPVMTSLGRAAQSSWLRPGHMPLRYHFSFPFYAIF